MMSCQTDVTYEIGELVRYCELICFMACIGLDDQIYVTR